MKPVLDQTKQTPPRLTPTAEAVRSIGRAGVATVAVGTKGPTAAPSSIPHAHDAQALVLAASTTIAQSGDTAAHRANSQAAVAIDAAAGGRALATSPLFAAQMSRGGEMSRDARLKARARPSISSTEMNRLAQNVFAPLQTLFKNTPDPRAFNAATWSAFQRAADVADPAALVAHLRGKQVAPADMPAKLCVGLSTQQVQTLALLLEARAAAKLVAVAELPSLPAPERAALVALVHDQGYLKAQTPRTLSPTSILVRMDGPQLVDDARLACLTDSVRARFALDVRRAAAGSEAAMPRLNLNDLLAAGTDRAVRFLQLSGKDVDAASPDLDGASMRAFLVKRPTETDAAFADRLQSKQVLNAFARPFEALRAEAASFGANGDKQIAFLEEKQLAAIAPVLLVATSPALFSRDVAAQVDGLTQVCWRVLKPTMAFSDPLVSGGIAGLNASHREELAKDRALTAAVIGIEKTRVLSGLRDDTFSDRMRMLLADRGIPLATDHVALAMSRLIRDAGSDNAALQELLPRVDRNRSDDAVVADLHALRHEPALFPLARVDTAPVSVGGLTGTFVGDGNAILPTVVGATTVGYPFRLSHTQQPFRAGEIVLLRLPKGARFSAAAGQLNVAVFEPGRFSDASARLRDFEVMHGAVAMTPRRAGSIQAADVQGRAIAATAVFERVAPQSACGQLGAGTLLMPAHVTELADQYVRGLLDIDPTSRPHGVFHELGPDNFMLDKRGLLGTYVDVAVQFRNERERGEFGFFQGGYGAAANWIVGDNTPLTPAQVSALWRAEDLPAAQSARRDQFKAALIARLDPQHPVYANAPAAHVEQVLDGLHYDAALLGLRTQFGPRLNLRKHAERVATDGVFRYDTLIERLPALTGAALELKAYAFVDGERLFQRYYRLAATDSNGRETFEPVADADWRRDIDELAVRNGFAVGECAAAQLAAAKISPISLPGLVSTLGEAAKKSARAAAALDADVGLEAAGPIARAALSALAPGSDAVLLDSRFEDAVAITATRFGLAEVMEGLSPAQLVALVEEGVAHEERATGQLDFYRPKGKPGQKGAFTPASLGFRAARERTLSPTELTTLDLGYAFGNVTWFGHQLMRALKAGDAAVAAGKPAVDVDARINGDKKANAEPFDVMRAELFRKTLLRSLGAEPQDLAKEYRLGAGQLDVDTRVATYAQREDAINTLVAERLANATPQQRKHAIQVAVARVAFELQKDRTNLLMGLEAAAP